MAAGSNRIAMGWILAIICWLIALSMLAVPAEVGNGIDSDGDGVDDNCDDFPNDSFFDSDSCSGNSGKYGSMGCCCLAGFMFLTLVDSGKKARMAAQSQVVFMTQQPVQNVVHHTYIQQPAQVVQQPVPVVQRQPVPQQPAVPKTGKTGSEWAQMAKNFEVARNWEKAAEAYEKAGLFAEAGRVREHKMEKSDSGVNIHVKSGDTYHDSVVMKDENEQFRID